MLPMLRLGGGMYVSQSSGRLSERGGYVCQVEVFARHFGIRVVEKDLSKGRSGPRPHAWVDSAVEAMAPFDDDAVFVEGVSMLAASVLRDSAQYAALTRLISRHSLTRA